MRALEGPENSRQYLYEALEADIPLQYSFLPYYIYRNLGWNYIESKQYHKALEAFEKALPLQSKELDKALIILLIGYIDFELGNDKKAQQCYSKTKEVIFLSESLRSKRLWIDVQLDLYCRLNQINLIKELFIELKELVDAHKFPESMLYELKATMYKRFEGKTYAREEHQLLNLF